MQSVFRYVPGLIALMASVVPAYACAAAPSAGAADPSSPNAAVAPTRYESFLPPKSQAPSDVSPADNWKEANRTVASFDSMSLTMQMDSPGSTEPSKASPGSPTTDGTAPTDPHAGHARPTMPPADFHAGHQMPAQAGEKAGPARKAPKPPDPHAGHQMPGMKVADPHAGHVDGEKK